MRLPAPRYPLNMPQVIARFKKNLNSHNILPNPFFSKKKPPDTNAGGSKVILQTDLNRN
jgi:hypothetical protein